MAEPKIATDYPLGTCVRLPKRVVRASQATAPWNETFSFPALWQAAISCSPMHIVCRATAPPPELMFRILSSGNSAKVYLPRSPVT